MFLVLLSSFIYLAEQGRTEPRAFYNRTKTSELEPRTGLDIQVPSQDIWQSLLPRGSPHSHRRPSLSSAHPPHLPATISGNRPPVQSTASLTLVPPSLIFPPSPIPQIPQNQIYPPSPPSLVYPPSPPSLVYPPSPPNPVNPPSPPNPVYPPSPPDQIFPPSPPNPIYPPSPPNPVLPPAPPPTPLVTPETPHPGGAATAREIRCLLSDASEVFVAELVSPQGFNSVPILNNNKNIEQSGQCKIEKKTGTSNIFHLRITDFNLCGISRQISPEGQKWLTVTVRFPYLGGLRTSDDEQIVIMCRPMETVASKSHFLDFRSKQFKEARGVFRSEPQDLQCKLLLFAQQPDEERPRQDDDQLPSGSVVKVGQDILLKAIVRPGNGWKFALLSDVVVQWVSKDGGNDPIGRQDSVNLIGSANRIITGDENERSTQSLSDTLVSSAKLVMGNGCRNPSFRVLAPNHPIRDPEQPLSVSFWFQAFMFQNMKDGDVLRVSARVIACMLEADCQPSPCLDDGNAGYGRRKRHAPLFKNTLPLDEQNSTIDFLRETELVVTFPSFSQSLYVNTTTENEIVRSSCRGYLVGAASVAGVLSIAVVAASAVFICTSATRRKVVPSTQR